MLTLNDLKADPQKRGFARLQSADKSQARRANGGNRTPPEVLEAIPDLRDEIALGAALFEQLVPHDRCKVIDEIEERKAAMSKTKFRELRGLAGYEPLTPDELGPGHRESVEEI